MAGSLFTGCGVVAIGLSSVRDRRGSEEPDLMPSVMDEALEWFDRAEQAREVAGQIAPPPMSYRPAALTETDAGATVMPSG